MIRIRDFVKLENIFELPAEKSENLFAFVADKLKQKGYIQNTPQLVKDLLEREKKGSTGVGDGIALPHTVIPGIEKPVVITILLRKAIDFNAIDGKPVRILFFVLASEQQRDDYLKILARLATVLHHEDVKRRIGKAHNKEDLFASLTEIKPESFFYKYRSYFYLAGVVAGAFLFALYFFNHVHIPDTASAAELGYLQFNLPIWVTRQIATFTIFLATVVGTLLFWRYRVAVASVGLGILLISGVMDLETTVKFMSIPTILFIICMMVVVAWLESNGVFDFVVTRVVKQTGPRPRRLYLYLLLLSVVLGGLTGEVTGIIITVTLAVNLARRFGIKPFPYVIGLVFATNIGSALTLIGNPIGIYIAFAGRLSFMDFLRWATPISLIASIAIAYFTLVAFRGQIPQTVKAGLGRMDEWSKVRDRREFYVSIAAFVALVLLIGLHRYFESILQLKTTTMIVAAPLIFVGIILFLNKERGKRFLVSDVDWWTILFFMFLFAKAACLEYTGVTAKIAYLLEHVAQQVNLPFVPAEVQTTVVAALLLLFFSAIASGFVDNLPIVAALVPIVMDLKDIGLPHASILWWALLFGGCFGGNLTMIGSSANVVALSKYEEITGRTMRFGQWFKYGLPVVILSLVIAAVTLILQVRLAP
ncbi:PTS sugar transporter subunit IIA [candidate division WOR-3 bacterium]|nr:PTS sugar transporter subunit IIA [candidate division WOR-3 bacterium]